MRIAGSTVYIIDADDGSGWTKVQNNDGTKGLVPVTYIELTDGRTPAPVPAPAVPSVTNSGSGEFGKLCFVRLMKERANTCCFAVKGLYVYQANGPDEIDVTPGAMIELSSGPGAGKDYAEGWWEGGSKQFLFSTVSMMCLAGYDMNGKKGIFPANYVEPA